VLDMPLLANCHVTNRFHVAVRLSTNRLQITSKCGKKNKWHNTLLSCLFCILYCFVQGLPTHIPKIANKTIQQRTFPSRDDVENISVFVSTLWCWNLIFFFLWQPFLTVVLIGQDLCVAMLYLLHFSQGPTGNEWWEHWFLLQLVRCCLF